MHKSHREWNEDEREFTWEMKESNENGSTIEMHTMPRVKRSRGKRRSRIGQWLSVFGSVCLCMFLHEQIRGHCQFHLCVRVFLVLLSLFISFSGPLLGRVSVFRTMDHGTLWIVDIILHGNVLFSRTSFAIARTGFSGFGGSSFHRSIKFHFFLQSNIRYETLECSAIWLGTPFNYVLRKLAFIIINSLCSIRLGATNRLAHQIDA